MILKNLNLEANLLRPVLEGISQGFFRLISFGVYISSTIWKKPGGILTEICFMQEEETKQMLSQNPQKQFPKISKKAWISETAVIIGNVIIEENVFVGPYAVIRADEPGSGIIIKKNCNVQDNVVLHGLSGSKILIEENTSLAHGCIVHGPCKIREGCFIGFGAVVFDCVIGKDSLILHNSTVRGIKLPPSKVVPDGMSINSQKDLSKIEELTAELVEFKRAVIEANLELVKGYRKLEN